MSEDDDEDKPQSPKVIENGSTASERERDRSKTG
jgi:hypothetical protein